MNLILFETSSASAADDVVTAVQAQELWGVNMGTTSKASSYSKFVLIEATATRVSNLISAAPQGVDMLVQYSDPPSFSDSTPDEMVWYLRATL